MKTGPVTLAAIAVLSVCASPAAAAPASPVPIMGFAGPEDLEVLPDGHALVVSSMIRQTDPAGGLRRLDLATGVSGPLPLTVAKAQGWGDPACAAPPQRISGHGIHLARRADGKWQLLVVNHAERESVEFLEIVDGGERAIWRGCVVSDEAFNDVATTPEGGFVASVPVEKAIRAANGGKAPLDGRNTGYLAEWRPGKGMMHLAGTDAPFSNGVQISADGRTLYYNAYTVHEVRRYDRKSGKETGRIKLDYKPDNLTWTRSGELIDAGVLEDPLAGCPQVDGVCAHGFVITLIDPKTLAARELYRAEPGVMAGVSTALQVGDTLYVGGYLGARMVKLKLGAETSK